MNLETAYANGQLAALTRLKLGFPAATHPVVQDSAILQSASSKDLSPQAKQTLQPPTTPFSVSQLFDVHEQAKTRNEPRRKLSADNLCTTCRKPKHYGTCKRPIAIKHGDFNLSMRGDDPTNGDNPSTSPNYHSATTADSALARARDGRPADEQAASGFADLYRHLGVTSLADQPGQMTGGLIKNSRAATLERMFAVSKLGNFRLPGSETHSLHEQRGTPINPYEERRTRISPPVGWGDEGSQRVRRAFDQIDNAADSTNIGGGFGEPSGGPAALG